MTVSSEEFDVLVAAAAAAAETVQSEDEVRQHTDRIRARVAEIAADPVLRAERDRDQAAVQAAEQALAAGRDAEARGEIAAAAQLYESAAAEQIGDGVLRAALCHAQLGCHRQALYYCELAAVEGFAEAEDHLDSYRALAAAQR